MEMRTPYKRVHRLGSAKSGSDHFWKQRVSAVANVFLVVWFVWLIASLAGADHATVQSAFKQPIVAIGLLLLVLSGVIHMRLGMQVVIEDYVQGEIGKITLLICNTFFAIVIGLMCIYAVLKLSFGS